MHLVGFIITVYHDARSTECQIQQYTVWTELRSESGTVTVR